MLYPVKELQDIFIDACVRAPDGELVFLSVFGRDGAVQQLYASLHLGIQEGGIRQITLLDPDTSQTLAAVPVGDPRRLDKYSGRLPKDNLFGNLVHTWIYDESLLTPSRATGSAWLLVDRETQAHDIDSLEARTWSLIEQLSPLPLLPHWRALILGMLGDQLVNSLDQTSYAPIGRIHASRIALPDSFSDAISGLVRNGALGLN
ncbi:MAG: hypothetical protein PCALPYG88_5701 [uncultured Paraburkholderia sp.]|uniref:hypothetical protein n=1 Tax=uncultured Paraburkholderia sp. TaxID=1822466 RepID=UPI00259ACF69|nr:hypothetical protein [uncultured Paraburkholderia sp.]CAH2902144.1 MAG: hypothetical protein PCALPYG08_5843 [uncultured Paraburkholderia sp.]CAH2936451.1 MAG: hypothetical protein PCALPYG88_5701 [uncultured Paraburkholderia sp.]